MAAEPAAHVAIDLGASSGRVFRGTLVDGRVDLAPVARFPNGPLRLPDGLHWDVTGLLRAVLDGIRRATRHGPVATIGVDAWGVDYGRLDAAGRLLGLPYHYRDGRVEGMVERAFARIPRERLYAVTGTQTQPFNTVFQLLADDLETTARIALIPDLMALWLSGELANEITAASTTGLLDARTGAWATAVAGRLGLPEPLLGDLVEPGTALGPLLAGHARDLGLARAPTVVAVAGHDTASAFAAAAADRPGTAVLSSGTWSLLGVELDEPLTGPAALAANVTNERGAGGTIRLLNNVMGLWLVQECSRAWGIPEADLVARAATLDDVEPALFDPDRRALLAPGDMPARLRAAIGADAPVDEIALVRATLVSLACKYRLVLERQEALTGLKIDTIQVVGGGARNEYLCQLTADVTGRQVSRGPFEAAALGNVLVQACDSLEEARALASASTPRRICEPAPSRSLWDERYARFLELCAPCEQGATA